MFLSHDLINILFMKKLILFILCTFTLISTKAQNNYSYIKFENSEVLVKDIQEEKGIVTISYKFTNTGTAPLIISNANTSTSRIEISYPKNPILPEKTGEITVKYDPTKKDGEFNRTITIISNAKNRIAVLYLKGNVIARPLSLEEQYPTLVNNLRYKKDSNRLYLNDVKNTEIKTDTIFLLNNSNETIDLEFKNIVNYIKISPNKIKIAPRKQAQLIVSFDGRGKNDYGYTYERLQLYINGTHNYQDDITINANIVEDFTKLSKKEMEKTPKMIFESTRFEFGSIKEGESTKHIFKFKNNGKSDLIIRKIKASCGCTAVTPKENIIKAGELSEIDITFNSANKRGRQHKFIYVICNDPNNPTIKLEVIGDVIEAENKE